MARVSFTLRRPDSATDKGSYLRYDDSLGVRTDQDSALRADGLQTAPTEFTTSFFDATSSCYGEVDLTWAVDITTTIGVTPVVTGVVVVYSALGTPQTIASGDILVESSDTFAYSQSGLTEGRWAYYSLFVHYQSSGGDSYYERVASLSVLVPKNYGSTLLLWNRIPEYYRLQDTALGDENYSPCVGSVPPGNVVGPLFKFLSIIGFDIDRIRTLLDYHMVSYDPQLANLENLDALAQQLGLDLRTNDLGGGRLRALLNDIGTFYRSKGTDAGTQLYAKAVSGSLININQTTRQITVYSQRVNYITTPKNGSGITTHRAAYATEAVTPTAFSTNMSAYSGTYSVSGSAFTTTGTGASVGVTHALIHLSSPVPTRLGDNICFSVQSNIGTSAIKWVRLVNGAGSTMGIKSTATNVNGSRVFEVTTTAGASVGVYTNSYVEYLVDLSAVPTFRNELLLAERMHLGSYFDGDTVRGGWLIDSSSVSDYRWYGSANSSVSIFAEDYERTKKVLDTLLWDVLPITEASRYTIVSVNAVPGF